jgi:hypothetical protein
VPTIRIQGEGKHRRASCDGKRRAGTGEAGDAGADVCHPVGHARLEIQAEHVAYSVRIVDEIEIASADGPLRIRLRG